MWPISTAHCVRSLKSLTSSRSISSIRMRQSSIVFSPLLSSLILQFQTGFRREPEQFLAHGTLFGPPARVPVFTADVISAVKQLRERDAAKLRDRKERRRFHLHSQTALEPPPLDLRSGLAIDAVRGPGLAGEVIDIMGLEGSFQRGYSFRACGHFAARRQVVIRRAFITDGRSG